MDNAQTFVQILKPSMAIFVKYEFWLNYLKELKNQHIKTLLINGLFRKNQIFFKTYGAIFQRALLGFNHIFLQNNASRQLLEKIGIEQTTVTGDLRYDRVLAISNHSKVYNELETFCNNSFVIIGGSTWEEEEKLLLKALTYFKENIKLIIAPHDVSERHLKQIESLFSAFSLIRFTKLSPSENPQIVLVDTIGHLSSIYKYGNAALVGGGFSGALHNILEPGVFGIPVFFGSLNQRFPEAKYFMENKIGYPINKDDDFILELENMQNNKERLNEIKQNANRVFKANSGGTSQVYFKIKGYLSSQDL